MNVEDSGGCGMLGGEGRQGNESMMDGEGESHASSTTDLHQIILQSQTVSRLEAVDEETATDTAVEVPPSLIINPDHKCTVSDETSRGGTLETKVVSRTGYVVEEKIHAVETTTTDLVPGQDASCRVKLEVRGIATDERIAQQPGHTEEAAARAEPVLQDNVIVHEVSSSVFSSSSRAS